MYLSQQVSKLLGPLLDYHQKTLRSLERVSRERRRDSDSEIALEGNSHNYVNLPNIEDVNYD